MRSRVGEIEKPCGCHKPEPSCQNIGDRRTSEDVRITLVRNSLNEVGKRIASEYPGKKARTIVSSITVLPFISMSSIRNLDADLFLNYLLGDFPQATAHILVVRETR